MRNDGAVMLMLGAAGGAVALAAQIALVELDGPTGQKIYVNPHEVSTLREARGMAQQHFAPGTQCVVFMTNGNILAVTEQCDTIRDRIEAAERGTAPKP